MEHVIDPEPQRRISALLNQMLSAGASESDVDHVGYAAREIRRCDLDDREPPAPGA